MPHQRNSQSFGNNSPRMREATALDMAPKGGKPEKRVQTSPAELLITYMTPWKNPNSIFVYMIATLIILGNISEAKNVSDAAGM